MEKYKNLNVFRYEDSEESVRNANKNGRPSIFLAGPTVRGNQPHLISWRYEAIEFFKELNFNGSLIVPEFTSKTESDKGKDWIPMWEYNGLQYCDIILFWIPRTRELIGLTTNWEQGYWMGKNIAKCVYGRPDESFRNNYNDLMWKQIIKEYNIAIDNAGIVLSDRIHKTLFDTINAAIAMCETIRWPNEKVTPENIYESMRLIDCDNNIGNVLDCDDLHNVHIIYENGGSELACILKDCDEYENQIFYTVR